MSFLHALVDSLSSLVFSRPVVRPMDAPTAAVVEECVVVKLRGYFELAKEEIDKDGSMLTFEGEKFGDRTATVGKLRFLSL
ncbi:spastin [Hordeum vulgare]|nr:spastin [Hordeum vulgare]KAI5008910.1 hypothetical protein ZWY2020_009958 [Hordeum vulgare]